MTSERTQAQHRYFNTLISVTLLIVFMLMAYPAYKVYSDVYDVLSGEHERQIVESEIAQIMQDENSGLKLQPHYDSLGKLTVGFGHLVTKGESFKNLTHLDAITLLRSDYNSASNSVTNNYPWAEGEVKLVLINMTYQLGANGLSKFKNTLSYLESEQYDLAASEMLNSVWAKQTPARAGRLIGRIMRLSK